MNDYERIARVIRCLDESFRQQPSLAALAQAAGLSPSHFHRLFVRWAGVTPKDFLQCLTAAHARTLLHRGANVLDTALASGLSGPGRLHDLCVTLEAATPGEIKSGGQDLTIHYGYADTPFGRCFLADTSRGICALAWTGDDPADEARALARLAADWPASTLRRSDRRARAALANLFTTDPRPSPTHPLRAFVRGSRFQVQVWRALLRTSPGTAVSYGNLATASGHPGAARAVGSALRANAVAFLIPCHRVIRETGALGQYRWGTDRKRALLAWESAPRRTSRLDAAHADS